MISFDTKGAFIIYGRRGNGGLAKSIGEKKSAPPPPSSRIHGKKITPHDTAGKILPPLPCFKNMPLCCCSAPTTIKIHVM